MSFLAPIFFAGLAALAIPVLVHLIQRERKEVVEFPSLMFIRKIPYQSVERRRIHNWLLLALRAAAMALVIAAFTRPFFHVDPLRAERLAGAREVVILLDRSASMGYGDRWKRAQDEARKVVNGLRGDDHATLVLFGVRPEETDRDRPTTSRVSKRPSTTRRSDPRRRAFGPALRFAQSLLTRSALPQKEAVLISDFQKGGWARQEEIKLPEGATLTPISLADTDTADLSIGSRDVPALDVRGPGARRRHGRADEPRQDAGAEPAGQARDRRAGARHAPGDDRSERVRVSDVPDVHRLRSERPRRGPRRNRRARRPTTTSSSRCRRAVRCRC